MHQATHGDAILAVQAPLGVYTARLHPGREALRLFVVLPDGTPVAPQGEARVVLTGTGEEAQQLVLSADGESWAGPARALGAPGYVAEVEVTVAGSTESATLTWGRVPTEPR